MVRALVGEQREEARAMEQGFRLNLCSEMHALVYRQYIVGQISIEVYEAWCATRGAVESALQKPAVSLVGLKAGRVVAEAEGWISEEDSED